MPETRIKCLSCGAILKLPASSTPGKAIRCPKCKEVIRIPAQKARQDEEEAADEPEQQEEEVVATPKKGRSRKAADEADEPASKMKPKKKEKENSPNRLVLGGIGVGVCVVIAVLIFVLLGKKLKNSIGDGGSRDDPKEGLNGATIERSFETGVVPGTGWSKYPDSFETKMAVSYDGSLIALAAPDQNFKVHIYETRTGKKVSEYTAELSSLVRIPKDFAFSHDNAFIATIEGANQVSTGIWVAIRDVKTGNLVRTLKTPVLRPGLSRVAFSPQGDVVYTGNHQYLCCLDCKTGTERRNWEPYPRGYLGFELSADGKRAVLGSREDPTLGIWDLATGTVIKEIKTAYVSGIEQVAISRDGKMAITEGYLKGANPNDRSEKQRDIWDLESGRQLSQIALKTESQEKFQFLTDKTLVLMTGGIAASTLHLVDVATGAEKRLVLARDTVRGKDRTLFGHVVVTGKDELALYFANGQVQILRLEP